MNTKEIQQSQKHVSWRRPSKHRQPIGLNDVTLRDGEQQEKKADVMPIADRIAVFDQLIKTGITRIEIGHLGNPHDQAYARSLVDHITDRSSDGDKRYSEVELQVLFGTHVGKLEEGVESLSGFPKDRVILHVYDRTTQNLRSLASEPYTIQDSASQVIATSMEAISKGFTRFSVSGEGSVDPDQSLTEATDLFYLPIISVLNKKGATSINVNLANTFGLSTDEVGEWSKKGLKKFNQKVKKEVSTATTSIHVHNDHRSATENSLDALEAGFDFVEGTIIGMGERAGNVALADVMVRLLEKRRSTVEASDRNEVNGKIRRIFGRMKIRRRSIWAERYLDQNLIENMGRWHNAAHTIGEIYATQNRFERTSLGDPEAYAAGSGPHAQANRAALENPVQHPLWRNYARTALEHDMLGRPEAAEVVRADRERLRTISLKTHAAGGSTAAMHAETVNEAGDTERKKSIQMARDHKEEIIGTISNTTTSRRIDIFQRRRSIRSRPVDPNSETAVFDSIKDGK